MSKHILLHALALILLLWASTFSLHRASATLIAGLGLEAGSLKLPKIQQCAGSIMAVPDCLNSIIFSALSLNPQQVGPTCCQAFLQIDQSCWPKLFILNPTFPSSLKDCCVGIQNSPPKVPSLPLPLPPPPPSPCSDGDDDGYIEDGS
ncbi:ECA1 gametogenesis related family protein [Striga asiatica]|uniref:ECA1 gametogenesis related family protein n=1 Tax=Striga asiatica TaxID=4170 RepID=A0A5A7PYG2_STRAF|nr:ECA1 gametogenesis related family protein [Striga asiatica]